MAQPVAKAFGTSLAAKLAASAVVAGCSFVGGDVLYSGYREWKRRNNVDRAFMTKVAPPTKWLVDRPGVENSVRAIIEPQQDISAYGLIAGSHGTGKTSAVLRVANVLGNGVIYVSVPSDVSEVKDALGRALNFDYDEHFSWANALEGRLSRLSPTASLRSPPQDAHEAWKRFAAQVESGAVRFRANDKNERIPTLVIDNFSHLVNKDPDLLGIMQDRAKEWADKGIIRVVFVPSTGKAHVFLRNRGAFSRCKTKIEIGDMTSDEALQLFRVENVPEDIAKKAFEEVTGGRVLDIRGFAIAHAQGQSFEAIKTTLYGKAKADFDDSQCYSSNEMGRYCRFAVRALLQSPSKRIPMESKPVDGSDSLAKDLVALRAFAYHELDHSLSFESTLHERFAASETWPDAPSRSPSK